MTYSVVNIKNTHPSFIFDNGLYAVIVNDGNTLLLCQLNENFDLELYDNGDFILSTINAKSKDVFYTNLKLEYNKK